MTVSCALCHSTTSDLVETISAADINRLYVRNLRMGQVLGVPRIDYWICHTCRLGFFVPPAAGGPELYEGLRAFPWYYSADKPEHDAAMPLLPAEGELLEVGAGIGSFARLVGPARYTGPS